MSEYLTGFLKPSLCDVAVNDGSVETASWIVREIRRRTINDEITIEILVDEETSQCWIKICNPQYKHIEDKEIREGDRVVFQGQRTMRLTVVSKEVWERDWATLEGDAEEIGWLNDQREKGITS